MAAGDVFSAAPTSVSNGASTDIRPASGEEATIHNIYYGGAVDIKWYDGTNTITFDQDTAAGARLGLSSHVTNTKYMRVTNTSGSTIFIGWDGIQTK